MLGLESAAEAALKLIPQLAVSRAPPTCCGLNGVTGMTPDTLEASLAMAEAALFPAIRKAGARRVHGGDGLFLPQANPRRPRPHRAPSRLASRTRAERRQGHRGVTPASSWPGQAHGHPVRFTDRAIRSPSMSSRKPRGARFRDDDVQGAMLERGTEEKRRGDDAGSVQAHLLIQPWKNLEAQRKRDCWDDCRTQRPNRGRARKTRRRNSSCRPSGSA